jgi:hypothetical protein
MIIFIAVASLIAWIALTIHLILFCARNRARSQGQPVPVTREDYVPQLTSDDDLGAGLMIFGAVRVVVLGITLPLYIYDITPVPLYIYTGVLMAEMWFAIELLRFMFDAPTFWGGPNRRLRRTTVGPAETAPAAVLAQPVSELARLEQTQADRNTTREGRQAVKMDTTVRRRSILR